LLKNKYKSGIEVIFLFSIGGVAILTATVLTYSYFGSVGSTWVVLVALIAWIYAAIGIDPEDCAGALQRVVRISRTTLVAIALAVAAATVYGWFLPAVRDGAPY